MFNITSKYFSIFSINVPASWVVHMTKALREKCPNTEFFLVRIFLYSDWNGDLLRKSSYSVRIQENKDQKKLCIWTLFTQWRFFYMLFLLYYSSITWRSFQASYCRKCKSILKLCEYFRNLPRVRKIESSLVSLQECFYYRRTFRS